MENVMTNGFSELSENEILEVDGGRSPFYYASKAAACVKGFAKDVARGNFVEDWKTGADEIKSWF